MVNFTPEGFLHGCREDNILQAVFAAELLKHVEILKVGPPISGYVILWR